MASELVHADGAITKHAKQSHLDDREIVLRTDLTEYTLNGKGKLRQSIHHAEVGTLY